MLHVHAYVLPMLFFFDFQSIDLCQSWKWIESFLGGGCELQKYTHFQFYRLSQ